MSVVALVVVGVIAGMLAAALGVGGGIVFVPALVAILGFDQQLAEGTSLAVILPTAIVGTIVHHRHRRVVWRTGSVIAAAGVVGAILGSKLAQAIHPTTLQRMFSVMLLAVALRMAIAPKAAPPEALGDDAGTIGR